MFDQYANIADKDITDMIKDETSGTLQDGYLAIGGLVVALHDREIGACIIRFLEIILLYNYNKIFTEIEY